MFKPSALLAIAATILLSACGGSGSTETPVANTSAVSTPPPAPSPTPVPITHSILVVGDSTMAAVSIHTDTPPSAFLAQLTDLTVNNQAVGGTTIKQLIEGNNGVYPKNLQQMLATDGSFLVIENYGLNDAIPTKGDSLSDYAASLTMFITQVRAAGRTPVLEEPNPVCSDAAIDRATLDQYVATLRNVAASTGTLLIAQYDVIKAIPGWETMMDTDCVHPLKPLVQIKAQNEYQAIRLLVSVD